MEYKLRLLHISDLHERADREQEQWRRRRVLGDQWLKNLDELLKDGQFHLVCFTGDVADFGLKQEYTRATDFFNALLNYVSLPRNDFFCIPGNHDVNRKTAKRTWKKFRAELSRADALEVSRWFAGNSPPPLGFKDRERQELLSRSSEYQKWIRETLEQPRMLPEPHIHPYLGYRNSLRLNNWPFDIHVIGLDSAWLSGDNHDAGKLRLTDDQVVRLASDDDGIPLTGFRLALVHHPLEDLVDASSCRRLLAEHVDLLLRGHLHEGEVAEWADQDRKLRQVVAGCLYEGHRADQYPNACHVIEVVLDAAGRPKRYDLRFRSWSNRGHWHDDDSHYPGTHNGRLVWLAEPKTPQGPPQKRPLLIDQHTTPDFEKTRVSTPPSFVPAVLDIGSWVGRGRLIKKLVKMLCDGRRVLLLGGLTGIGKTALAERVVLELLQRSEFTSRPVLRHIFDRENEPESFAQIAYDWLDQQSIRVPRDVQQNENALLSLLVEFAGSVRPVFILDAVERILDADSQKDRNRNCFREGVWLEFCRAVLHRERLDCRLILTSQDNPSDLEQIATDYQARWHPERVEGLDPNERKRFFSKFKLQPPRGSEEEKMLESIGRAYQGHPLALRTIAGEIRAEHGGSINSFWTQHGEEIEEAERALAEIHDKDEQDGSGYRWQLLLTNKLKDYVKRRLDHCFARLLKANPDAHFLLCAASEYDEPVNRDLWFQMLDISGIPEKRREAAFQMLSERFLIDVNISSDGQPKVVLHSLVHSVAREQFYDIYGRV